MRLENLAKVLETDVLVAGGGTAGCLAAIGARDQGADVIVVDKGVIETSGCMGHGIGEYKVQLYEDEDDTDDAMASYMAKPPRGYSYRISMETHAKLNNAMFKRLEGLGWEFLKNPDGTYWRSPGFGQTGKGQQRWVVNGGKAKRLVAREVRRVGTHLVGHIQLTKLLTNKGRVIGAVGFNIRNAEFYVFRAKTVVCTMGAYASRSRANNSTNNPFNSWMSPAMTGSGLVLPYEAGAKIIGLDNLGSPRATVIPKGFAQIGLAWYPAFGIHIVNAMGEKYLEKAGLKRGLAESREKVVLQTYREQFEGKAPLHINASRLSAEDYLRLREVLTTVGTLFIEYWQQRGIDFSKDSMEMECGELGEGGMLLKNEQGELYPLGRGLYGSTGYFVPPAMCGGYKAGTEAAKEASKLKKLIDVDAAQIRQEKDKVMAPLSRKTGYNPKEFENMIRGVMTYYAGFIRNEQGMRRGLNGLKLVEEQVGEIKAQNPHELLRGNEAITLLKFCQLALPASIERRESGRGQSYIRSDYPHLDKAWDNKFIVQWQEEGESKLESIKTDSKLD